MRVEVVDRLGPGEREAWDALVDRQDVPSPFLRSWWIDGAATGRPAVLRCYDGDRLVGGAAFEEDVLGVRGRGLERVRVLGHGTLSPDHLDVIAEPDARDEVVDRVVRWLRRPGSRIVDLDGYLATSELPGRLGARVLERHVSPYLPLDGDAAAVLAGRPGKLRSTIKRTTKRLAKAGFTPRRVPPTEAARALRDLERLHDARWSEDSRFLEEWLRFEPLAAAAAAHGDVVLYELADEGGEVIAVELDLVAAWRSGFYQAGRSTAPEHRGAGSVLKYFAVSDAIDHGLREYDLLRGDEGYKREWAEGERALVRVVAAHGPLGHLVRSAGLAYIAAVGPLLEKQAARRQARRTASSTPAPAGPTTDGKDEREQ